LFERAGGLARGRARAPRAAGSVPAIGPDTHPRRRPPRHEDERDAAARTGAQRPAEEVDRVLALQRAAGNHAVGAELQRMRSATLQRKVKVAKSTLTEPPIVSKAILKEFPHLNAKALREEATKWIADKTNDKTREFTDADLFYRAVAKTLAVAAAPSEDQRWTVLGKAAKKSGKVTEVKWSTFNTVEAPQLLAELQACTIQLSSNPDTTAAHGNAHGKLPKKGLGDKLHKLSHGDQCDKTPYYEFLVTGQPASGITRGVFDKDARLVYLTAHYDQGSFVLLSGAPAGLLNDWGVKVAAFIRTQKGQ
jgi:hypothetical protein